MSAFYFLGCAVLLLSLIAWILNVFAARMGSVFSRALLRLFYQCVGFFGLAVFLLLQVPRDTLPRPRVQVFDSRDGQKDWFVTVRDLSADAESATLVPVAKIRGLDPIPVFAGLIALGFAAWMRDRRRLRRKLRGLIVLRKIGRIHVAIGPTAEGAYSCLGSRLRPWIVLPESALLNPSGRRMIYAHEAQHHRQGDLAWVTFFECMRRSFFWHPVFWFLHRSLRRNVESLQEFSCDESVVRRRHSPREYGHCLIQCAEEALLSASGKLQSPNFGTTSFFWPAPKRSGAASQREFLRRRIAMIVSKSKVGAGHGGKWFALRAGVLAVVVAGAVASISLHAMVGGAATVTLPQLQKLIAENPRKGSDGRNLVIPIEINELVVNRLNRYLSTWQGRKFLQETRQRMPIYEKMIREHTDLYGLPQELVAIPFFESGFDNDAVSPAPARSAGIWQFIAETARRYGLKVGKGIDERKNPEKETVAAMKFLGKLHRQFGDWRLAIKAYNEGESRVEYLIDKYGTRDPWKLERISSRESYLTGVMAALILILYPELLIEAKNTD